jgi:hypothetical protein
MAFLKSDRFWSKVDIHLTTDRCWNWMCYPTSNGYGQFRVGKCRVSAHRVAYELAVGPIPDGLHIDHLCSNRLCMNPWHLEPVTVRENNLRSLRRKQERAVG